MSGGARNAAPRVDARATPEVEVPTRSPEMPTGGRGGGGSWATAIVTAVVGVGSLIAVFLPLQREAIGAAACLLMLTLIFLRMPIAIAMIVPS